MAKLKSGSPFLYDANDKLIGVRDPDGQEAYFPRMSALPADGDESIANLTVTALFKLSGVEDALTAHAGGTKAAALALSATKSMHRVSTVGSAADSVLMPAATAGAVHFVRNDGANAMQVFGAGTDTINGVVTATGISMDAATGKFFVCLTAGAWVTS